MRGRKPVPIELKVLRGNPGKRPLTTENPLFTAGIPDKPKDLNPDESKEWDRLTRELDGVLSVADYGILRLTVDAYARFVRTMRALNEHGMTYETCNSQGARMIRLRPEVKIMEQVRKQYLSCLVELGATPAQHGRVSLLRKAEPKSEMEELLGI
ncbi:hypothetical protein YTPLAS18_17160 [Nitrospira sp.]|nr:hypothetical protein YTPLAS18_17160 [Nitrospira sp.]